MGLASHLLLGKVSRSGATELKSFRATVASFLSNMFLLGSSVALSIHIVLTFFRMHGLALTLAFVVFWLISVTAYLQWKQQQSKPRTVSKASTHERNSRKPTEAWRERQSA
jgi:glucan phosphoethanolaminetransferase (alkaline phosphatase superfamily)